MDQIRKWVVALLILIFAVLAWGVALLNQNIDDSQRIGKQNQNLAKQNDRFIDNFSNYMTCLIIGEEEVVLAVGKEAYVEICKQLLYRGITPIPPTIKAEIPEGTPTTTTTEGA